MLVQRISYLRAASKKPEAGQLRRLARDDKGGEQQKGIAARILAEIISSDVAQLVTFNQAIEGVIQNNPKARANHKAVGSARRLR